MCINKIIQYFLKLNKGDGRNWLPRFNVRLFVWTHFVFHNEIRWKEFGGLQIKQFSPVFVDPFEIPFNLHRIHLFFKCAEKSVNRVKRDGNNCNHALMFLLLLIFFISFPDSSTFLYSFLLLQLA